MNTSKNERIAAYEGRSKWANDLLNEITPTGKIIGVEVGLWKADFGVSMLNENPRLSWYGVDPYFQYPVNGEVIRSKLGWDGMYKKVVGKTIPFGERYTLIRKPSWEGVEDIPDGVDFVFIDGDHDYDIVLKDLFLYEKKVRSGGIMSGHDYSIKKHQDGVIKAVDEYAKKFGRDIHVDNSFDPCGIFWWRVP